MKDFPPLSKLHTIFPPPAPNSLPPFFLIQSSPMLHPEPTLNPFLRPHLAQAAQSAGESEALLVAGEEAAAFHHLHAHAEIVHHLPHHVVDAFVLLGRFQ